MTDRWRELGEIPPLWVVASIAGVASFGLAQPLLDLLGRNPEFFIARRFPAGDIITLALGLVLFPVLVAIPSLLLRRVSRTGAAVAHVAVLAVIVTIVVTTVLVTLGLGGWPPPVFFAASIAGGGLVAWLFVRFSPVRSALVYLGWAPVAFVVWFLLFTATSQLVRASSSDLPEAGTIDSPVPVVMVVFDEFPEASLMHADGSLDKTHFPSFARLAADGVWYRNAVGVRQQTEEALPSILTGVGVSDGSIPTISDHPFNLFTLFSEAYDVSAVENVTDLCPSYVCSNDSRPQEPLADRWRAVLTDLAVVYGHLTLPKELSALIPPIDQGWGDFDQQTAKQFDIIERFLEQVDDDRRREVVRFLDTFDTIDSEPPLRFAHFLYPHHPWDLTAEGQIHGAPRPPGRFEVGWGPDEFLVAQGWQRHLIQAQWTDDILGRILDRLESEGLYDEALVVVVADHGITIEPNTEHQRIITSETIGSVAAVPMFIKYPEGLDGPDPGAIDDLRAVTTDLLPTIADVVDVTIPWHVDGVSLLDSESRARRVSSVMAGSRGGVDIPVDDRSVLEVAAEKESWFPGGDPYDFTPRGWEELLGETVVAGSDSDGVMISISQEADLAAYQPGADRVPSYLSGSVNVAGGASGTEILAVTVDGRVAAVTRTYEPDGDSARWEAMIDPHLLESGQARVEVWLVDGSSTSASFVR